MRTGNEICWSTIFIIKQLNQGGSVFRAACGSADRNGLVKQLLSVHFTQGVYYLKYNFIKKDRMKSKLGYINPYAMEHCAVTCGCSQGLLAGL